MGQPDKCDEHKNKTHTLDTRVSVLEEKMTLVEKSQDKITSSVEKLSGKQDDLKDAIHKVHNKSVVTYTLVMLLLGSLQTLAVGLIMYKLTNPAPVIIEKSKKKTAQLSDIYTNNR